MLDTVDINSKLDIIRALREEKAELDKQKDAEESRIRFLYESEVSKLEAEEKKLIDEITSILESNGKSKIKCLNGTIAKRKSPAKYLYEDKLLSELQEKGYEQFIRTKYEVDKITLKSDLIVGDDGSCYTPEGEKIDNVRVIEGDYSWRVKIND